MSMKIIKCFFCALFTFLTAGSVMAADSAGNIVLDVRVDTPFIESGKPRKVVVQALVRPELSGAAVLNRAPLAVAIVLDKSGSMGASGKMDNAKRGAIEALKMLGDRDIATVVVYDSQVRTIVKPRSAGNIKNFEAAISDIAAEGSTALYDGLRSGAAELEPFIKEGYIPRIILLSDGLANVGPSSASELAEFASKLSRRDITVTTIGLGLDYNEDLMTAVAARSGGNSYFARTAENLREIFVRDMEDAVTLTARHVKVSIVCRGNVTPLGTIGRESSLTAREITAPIDNLYSGEKFALFEVEIPAMEESEFEAATLRLEYTSPESGKTHRSEQKLKIKTTKDIKLVENNRNAAVIAETALARNAEVREEVVRLADSGELEKAKVLLQQRSQELKVIAPQSAAAAPKIASEAEYLDDLAESIDESGSISSERRKEAVNEAYIMKNQQK